MKHFKSSILITVIGLSLALFIGGLHAFYIVALLAILEVSLSFDNAVVNAKVLETMERKWQQRFITWGIPIAVFGMRFLFPILIVAIASGMSVFQTFNIALNDPETYKTTLNSVQTLIYAFGGSFLMMVFLHFIFETDREEKWINIIESSNMLGKMGEMKSIQMVLTTTIGIVITFSTQSYEIAVAYFMGLVLYSLIASLDELFNINGIRNGMMGFLYLEVLDASFSFDGVIGAFALSSDIFVIMIGLGIGAMFVRSLTLYMLEKKTLTEYRYLEHGAHYAIFALSIIMLAEIFIHIDEMIVGTIGVVVIAIAIYNSVQANRISERLTK
jgi:hypothetical protein